jgi:hypothetical protein
VVAQGAKPPEAGEFSAFLTLNLAYPEKEIYMKIIRIPTFKMLFLSFLILELIIKKKKDCPIYDGV